VADPGLRRLAGAVGVVDGNQDNAERLLEAGELLLVLPGGLREAVKPRELRYQLLWGQRYGFVRLALRQRAPLIPLACVGADDLFDFVGNAYARGSAGWGGAGCPCRCHRACCRSRNRTSFRFIVGEPIVPDAGPDRAEDEALLKQLRHEVAGALHELIENELARRAGIGL
jgi:1-acyl-sn-glycerol-3-phosphate acyltransferase